MSDPIYPIQIRKQSGRAPSASGGKEYHLVLITLADHRTLFIKRFGKAGTWGVGFDVERYEDAAEGQHAYQKKYTEKLGKDYSEHFINTTATCHDWVGFRKAVGEQYWNKLGKGNIEWIMPGADTTGVREGKSIEFELGEDGRTRVVEPKRRMPVEPAPPIESPSDRAKQTPIWGMF